MTSRERFEAAWVEALQHDEGWSDAAFRVCQACEDQSAARIAQLEGLLEGKQVIIAQLEGENQRLRAVEASLSEACNRHLKTIRELSNG